MPLMQAENGVDAANAVDFADGSGDEEGWSGGKGDDLEVQGVSQVFF
jgi:hypothetical protein